MRKGLILGITLLTLVIGYFIWEWKNDQAPQGSLPIQQEDKDNSVLLPGGSSEEDSIEDPLKKQIEAMTLEEKVGQLVMVGLDGYEFNPNAQKFIQEYKVGGFILLKKNVQDTQQALRLVNSLKEANGDQIPLFLAIDEEGGRISRMPADLSKMPSSQKIGTLNNKELARRVGEILGQEVKEFGLNVNFAPVLDIYSNPKNTVIGDRAFGSTPELVSSLGIQVMKGIQEQDVIPVVKHFPGHGDTAVDSHIGLPRVDYDLERLRSFELVPFKEAVSQQVDGIMLAHILIPKIDPDYPASCSRAVITELLRTELNYQGVVITDDLTMGAILENYNIGEVAVKSIQAGSDIVLVCHDFAKEELVIQELLKAARTGEISTERLNESVYRVLKLKEKYALSNSLKETVDVQSLNDEIQKLYGDYPALK